MPSHSFAELAEAWELFRDPIVCAGAAGLVLGFLSVYVVLRRMVFVSAAVTQSAGLGVALSFYAGIHLSTPVEPLLGAAVLSIGATLLLLADPSRLHMTRESLLGLLFALSAGAAIIVGDRISQEAHDIQAILFGTAVLVRPLDLRVVLIAGAAVLAIHLWLFRTLTFANFDPIAARVQGLPVATLESIVLVSIGLMVGVAARALGALPVFALSTLPAIAVLLTGIGLRGAFVVAALAGASCGVLGYLAAFFYDLPVGSAQTATAGLLVVLTLAGGLAARLLRQARTRLAAASQLRDHAHAVPASDSRRAAGGSS